LLEVLLTVALIALLGGVLIAGSARLLSDRPVAPEDILRKAIDEARRAAVESNREVRLAFDSKVRTFKMRTAEGVRSFPLEAAGECEIDFLTAQKGAGVVLLGGVVVETQSIPYITFYSDGTCSPFRVQLRTAGSAWVMAIDPWTCAAVLESEKK